MRTDLCVLTSADFNSAVKEAELEISSLCDGQSENGYNMQLSLYGMTADQANAINLTAPRTTDVKVHVWSIEVKTKRI
ncbi:MAG: hypothetical protein HRT95_13130 [Moritella sp.]|uniref:hypothetical protein n=1 Tax=Moritella sp. TaxID=78556 RepID=UPI001E06DCDB|nr:hypothetical protein [Moritella sp.]NQZ51069.1 hypothetical protein [Moritella sp.]